MNRGADTSANIQPSWLAAVVDELALLQSHRVSMAAAGHVDSRLEAALRARGVGPLRPLALSPRPVELVVCGADLSLAEGTPQFERATQEAAQILLLVTPEAERSALQSSLPLCDEWVRWFSSRGFGRDFDSTFATAAGALFLSRQEPGSDELVGGYERRLEQLEREVVVLRNVAGEYGHELYLREQALDLLHARLDTPEAMATAASTAELAQLMRLFSEVRRRFAPADSARIRAFDWMAARLVEVERALLEAFDRRDQLLARARRLARRFSRRRPR